eukprot:TRINITY_DN68717_c0_g1_i1.p1 TRINITY_DN68717_c0_g1~~TRINITY_DN68717_c0_g1_i1.p1  ORF type:complete len:342 (+),score=70.16 TRINITY_DN68717_c0_g1_i1:94-1119(+)
MAQAKAELIVGQKYRLGRKIGAGSFGTIYMGINIESGEEIAVKLESVKAAIPQLIYEAKVYKLIGSRLGYIPRVHWYGVDGDFHVMVLDLLGPSLEDLFDFCEGTLGLKTVLMLADQTLHRIEYVHARNFIHRDIKPENFVVGLGQFWNSVHVIDFGLAKKYRNPETQVHQSFADAKKLTGTAEYASMYTHFGYEQSRRDDLESIGFMLYYLLLGSLPWQDLGDLRGEAKHQKILKKKLATPVEVLGRELPSEFVTYMLYCRDLSFEDRPDYTYPRMLWKEVLFREHCNIESFTYDWDLLYEQRKRDKEARYGWKAEPTVENELATAIRDKKIATIARGKD